jgi:hypothetical protein
MKLQFLALALTACLEVPDSILSEDTSQQDFQVCCDDTGCGFDVCDNDGSGGGNTCYPSACNPDMCWTFQRNDGSWGFTCIRNPTSDNICATSGGSCSSCAWSSPVDINNCYLQCNFESPNDRVFSQCEVSCRQSITTRCE